MAEDDLNPPLAEAVRALAGRRGPCPPAASLVEYGALPVAERARHDVHDHVQVCSRCQLVLLNLEEPAARPSSRWVLPLAAALAIAALAPVMYRALNPPAAVEDTVRGTELQPVAPVGEVSAVSAFEWQSPIRASKYRIAVYRGPNLVWTTDAGGARVALPAGVTIEPGVEHSWQASALDAEGTVRMSSPRTAFTIRP